ncbi:hypothetical protein NMY22_g10690 [Coprinellus aureogranulatus]|nr:hypothetical protein NMY22_g10690 [Coprinellus aureogranulatus]
MTTGLTIPWTVTYPFSEENLSPEEFQELSITIGEFTDSPSTFEWFKKRGYTLFQRDTKMARGDDRYPRFFCPQIETPRPEGNYAHAVYPFPHQSYLREGAEEVNWVHARMGKIWFAQDSQGRHVVMKLVPQNSDELRVYELIRKQSFETLERVCLLPVLDMLFVPGYCFVVMPRWGERVRDLTPTLKPQLEIMHSLLKAVDFLHSHNIVHRDISEANILVNHFTVNNAMWTVDRSQLSKDGLLLFALYDFDISVVFPKEAERSKCRLPSERSCEGPWPKPTWDTSHGEIDYDPFAYDVGCMGLLFCTWVQTFTPALPFLAPLLDRMTDRNPKRRFTAREAREFFEEHIKDVDLYDLGKPYYYTPLDHDWEEYDRWKDLTEEQVAQWAPYR